MTRIALSPPSLFLTALLVLVAGCTDPSASGSPSPAAFPSATITSEVAEAGTSLAPTDSSIPVATTRNALQLVAAGTVASSLQSPWGIGFLPDGSALVTERDTGLIKQIPASTESDGSTAAIEIGAVQGVTPAGEGGLLGLAVSPTFDVDHNVFVYFTGENGNEVDRLTFIDGAVSDQQPVLTGIPSGSTHNGGRIVFGPDGNLYIGTGDAGERSSAQDLTSLAGKILRIAPDGTAPAGNPFPDAPLIFSLGHRNVQGITFDEAGRVWAAEFGPSSLDELNLVVPGNNYGWPVVEGFAAPSPYTDPERVWPTSQASPSGIAFARGSLWMAGLRGETLWEIPVLDDGTTGEPIAHLSNEFGRLRTVLVAPDKSLWVSTSNTDGRGDPAAEDDRILRFTLS